MIVCTVRSLVMVREPGARVVETLRLAKVAAGRKWRGSFLWGKYRSECWLENRHARVDRSRAPWPAWEGQSGATGNRRIVQPLPDTPPLFHSVELDNGSRSTRSLLAYFLCFITRAYDIHKRNILRGRASLFHGTEDSITHVLRYHVLRAYLRTYVRASAFARAATMI